MEFNIDKCVIMNIGTLRNKSKFEYKIKNKTLEVVRHHPYLGVELTDNIFKLCIALVSGRSGMGLQVG